MLNPKSKREHSPHRSLFRSVMLNMIWFVLLGFLFWYEPIMIIVSSHSEVVENLLLMAMVFLWIPSFLWKAWRFGWSIETSVSIGLLMLVGWNVVLFNFVTYQYGMTCAGHYQEIAHTIFSIRTNWSCF